MKLVMCRVMSQANLVAGDRRYWTTTRLAQEMAKHPTAWECLLHRHTPKSIIDFLLTDDRLFEPLSRGSSYYCLKCNLGVAQDYLNEDVMAFGDQHGSTRCLPLRYGIVCWVIGLSR